MGDRIGEPAKPLDVPQRLKVMELLRGPLPIIKRKGEFKLLGSLHEDTLFGPIPDSESLYTGRKKSITVPDIRETLGLGKRRKNDPVSLNIERDEERILNDERTAGFGGRMPTWGVDFREDHLEVDKTTSHLQNLGSVPSLSLQMLFRNKFISK